MTETQYTHGHSDGVLRSHRWRTAENSAAYLLHALQPGMSMLDVGCGPGTITADLARRVAPGRVVGIDQSEEVIEEARTEHFGQPEGVLFEVADVYDLPFGSSQFNVVHAHQVLQHLDDPVRALEEMKRVAMPGGIIAARDADYGSFAWYPEIPELDAWGELYAGVARSNGGEPNGGRHLVSWVHRAGLIEVSASVTSWCFVTNVDRQWWSELWAERTTSSRFALRALELGLCSSVDLQEMARAWRQWGSEPDGWFSVPSGEVLCRVPGDTDELPHIRRDSAA